MIQFRFGPFIANLELFIQESWNNWFGSVRVNGFHGDLDVLHSTSVSNWKEKQNFKLKSKYYATE